MIKLPRLYNKSGTFVRLIQPVSLSLTLNLTPLSTATIELKKGENIPSRGYVELFTQYGSAGMYRVRSPHDTYGSGTTTADLEHAVAEVGDWLVKDEIKEMMAANTAASKIFNHYKGSMWSLGKTSALGSKEIAVDASYDRVLDVLLEILQQVPDCMMSFDFTKKPWVLNFVKKDTSVTAEGRLTRNVESATVSYDDTELVTRLWYQTFDSKGKGTWTHKDASTRNTYGTIEGTVNTSADMTAKEISKTVDTFLSEHSEPRISVDIEANELSHITGESIDKFIPGKLFRLVIPQYNVTVEKTITSLVWDDVYYDSDSISVHLGDDEDTVVTFLHNLDSKGSGGGGGGGRKKDDEDKWSEYYSEWNQFNDYIGGYVQKTDRTGRILEKAGLDITSSGVLIYSQDNENMIGARLSVSEGKINAVSEKADEAGKILSKAGLSIDANTGVLVYAEGKPDYLGSKFTNLSGRIEVQKGRISLVVEGEGANAKIKRASIVAAINNDGSSGVYIKADQIDLTGYVTATQLTTSWLSGLVAQLSNLSTRDVTVTGGLTCSGRLTASTVGAMTMELGGASFSSVITGASVSGNTLTLTPLTGNAITFSKATSLDSGWDGGRFSVTAKQNGTIVNSVSTAITNDGSSHATYSSGTVSIPVYSDQGDTGKEVYLSAGKLSNATGSLHKYGTTTMYIEMGGVYSSAGRHTWYYKDTDSNLAEYTYVNI